MTSISGRISSIWEMRNSLNIAERVIIMITTPRHFCATAAAIALFGVHYTMGQARSDPNIPTVPTNIPDIQTAVAPPTTFDPISASAGELQRYGFPPEPDQLKFPEAYKAWAKAVSAPHRWPNSRKKWAREACGRL